jgi:WD40 repeat protein
VRTPTKKVSPASLDPAHTRLVQTLAHDSPLLGCRLDPAGRFVFAGAQDRTIQRWELTTGKKTALRGAKSWVRGLAFSASQKVLLAGDYAGQLHWWPFAEASPTVQRAVSAHHGWVRAVAVSPDGRLAASCGNDHRVKLWSVADGKLVRELAGHTCHVYNVAFHPRGHILVSADLQGVIKHWEVGTGALVRNLDAALLHKYDATFRADIGGIRSMAFGGDGAVLACAGITEVQNAFAGVGKPLVVLFDWTSGKQQQRLVPKEPFQGTAWGVGFHPSGWVIGAGGGNGGVLWFWKPQQGPALFTLKLPANARDLDLHADGQRLAVACADGAVRIYSVAAKVPS